MSIGKLIEGVSDTPSITLSSQGIVARNLIRAGRELVAVVIAAPVRATRGTAGDTRV